MDGALDIQNMMTAAKAAPVMRPGATSDPKLAKGVAEQFEGILITQFLSQMFEGISTEGMFGGGPGESMFRSMIVDEYGKQMAANGGLGLSSSIQREMLKMQEHGK